MSTDLSTAIIEASLTGRWGRPPTYYDTVDSTNERALELLDNGAPEGALVVANHQTAGRGRRGRSWDSPAGTGLLFSLVLRPGNQDALELLTTVLGVAVSKAIESRTGVLTQLKWPNDVTVNDRKLAGILVESRLSGGAIEGAVAGVGVNVTWPADVEEEVAPIATSLEAIRRQDAGISVPTRPELLAAMVAEFENLYDRLEVAAVREEVIREATERSAVLGREVVVRFADGTSRQGRALGLTATGALKLEVTDGGIEVLSIGEVERLRPR